MAEFYAVDPVPEGFDLYLLDTDDVTGGKFDTAGKRLNQFTGRALGGFAVYKDMGGLASDDSGNIYRIYARRDTNRGGVLVDAFKIKASSPFTIERILPSHNFPRWRNFQDPGISNVFESGTTFLTFNDDKLYLAVRLDYTQFRTQYQDYRVYSLDVTADNATPQLERSITGLRVGQFGPGNPVGMEFLDDVLYFLQAQYQYGAQTTTRISLSTTNQNSPTQIYFLRGSTQLTPYSLFSIGDNLYFPGSDDNIYQINDARTSVSIVGAQPGGGINFSSGAPKRGPSGVIPEDVIINVLTPEVTPKHTLFGIPEDVTASILTPEASVDVDHAHMVEPEGVTVSVDLEDEIVPEVAKVVWETTMQAGGTNIRGYQRGSFGRLDNDTFELYGQEVTVERLLSNQFITALAVGPVPVSFTSTEPRYELRIGGIVAPFIRGSRGLFSYRGNVDELPTNIPVNVSLIEYDVPTDWQVFPPDVVADVDVPEASSSIVIPGIPEDVTVSVDAPEIQPTHTIFGVPEDVTANVVLPAASVDVDHAHMVEPEQETTTVSVELADEIQPIHTILAEPEDVTATVDVPQVEPSAGHVAQPQDVVATVDLPQAGPLVTAVPEDVVVTVVAEEIDPDHFITGVPEDVTVSVLTPEASVDVDHAHVVEPDGTVVLVVAEDEIQPVHTIYATPEEDVTVQADTPDVVALHILFGIPTEDVGAIVLVPDVLPEVFIKGIPEEVVALVDTPLVEPYLFDPHEGYSQNFPPPPTYSQNFPEEPTYTQGGVNDPQYSSAFPDPPRYSSTPESVVP